MRKPLKSRNTAPNANAIQKVNKPKEFVDDCSELGIPPSSRQFRKLMQGRGLVYEHRLEKASQEAKAK